MVPAGTASDQSNLVISPRCIKPRDSRSRLSVFGPAWCVWSQRRRAEEQQILRLALFGRPVQEAWSHHRRHRCVRVRRRQHHRWLQWADRFLARPHIYLHGRFWFARARLCFPHYRMSQLIFTRGTNRDRAETVALQNHNNLLPVVDGSVVIT